MRATDCLRISIIKAITFCSFAGIILMLSTCRVPDLSSEYGIVKINVAGKDIFFKREIRGLSYDTLVLSPNNNLCQIPDANLDYVFDGLGPIRVYYKTEGDTIVLYALDKINPPKGGQFPVQVVQNKLNTSKYEELDNKAVGEGFTLLDIPPDGRSKCNNK